MNCNEFKTWIANRDLYDKRVHGEADTHVASCAQCRRLFELDDLAEYQIREGMRASDVPRGLLDRIEADISSSGKDKGSRPVLWTKFVPIFATAVLALILIVNPFSSRIQTLDQMGTYVLENHFTGHTNAAFNAADVTDVAGWFSKRLGYAVEMPDLRSLGLTLQGGKRCSLGKKRAAYLFCDRKGQMVSLFVVNAGALGFKLDKDRTYGVYDRGGKIKIWQEGGMVYALVENQAV